MDNVDSFKFLVPGLSHLSTDTEQIVNVLIQQLPFITQYVEFCCTKLLSDRVSPCLLNSSLLTYTVCAVEVKLGFVGYYTILVSLISIWAPSGSDGCMWSGESDFPWVYQTLLQQNAPV